MHLVICHSSQDKAVADAACAALERAGVVCWIAPRDPLPGSPYGQQIIEAVENADVVLLIFSEHANSSEHVSRTRGCRQRQENDRAVSHRSSHALGRPAVMRSGFEPSSFGVDWLVRWLLMLEERT